MKILNRSFCSLLLIVASSLHAHGAQQEQFDHAEILEGIKLGHPSAILAAGRSGDPSFVPALKQEKNDPGSEEIESDARKALAKLGEIPELREIVCNLNAKDGDKRRDAVEDLKYVKGWSAVHHLMPYLLNEEANNKPVSFGDVVYGTMLTMALQALPDLVKNPPYPAFDPTRLILMPQDQLEMRGQQWRAWIHQHEAELRQLYPNEEIKEQDCAKPSDRLSSTDKKLISRAIREGNVRAIRRAGNSLDRTFVPELRKALSDPAMAGSGADSDILLALAKLGEREERQYVACETVAPIAVPLFEAAKDLEYIGGWFGIQGFLKMFDEDEKFEKALEKYHSDAILAGFPSAWSLEKLPRIIRNPPAFADDGSIPPEQRIELWRRWIDDNYVALSKLEPTDAGVVFSEEACQKYYTEPKTEK